jgi:sugar transferase (PEP-CTERM system associated)
VRNGSRTGAEATPGGDVAKRVIRVFKHYVAGPVLLLGGVELGLLYLAAVLAARLRTTQIGFDIPIGSFDREGLVFAGVVALSMLAVGVYQADAYRSLRLAATRLIVAMALAFVGLALLFFLFPGIALWRSISLYAALIGFVLVMVARVLFDRLVSWTNFRRRILVLGAGTRAAKLKQVAAERNAGFVVARYVTMGEARRLVDEAQPRVPGMALKDKAEQLNADEIVLALDERRGALPVADLLAVKLAGIPVTDMSSFLERETGRVDVASISPSWLIFSDGFLGAQTGALVSKRIFDIAASALLLVIASPLLVIAAVAVRLSSRGPIFYLQERVGLLGKPFNVIKFRSMTVDAEKASGPQWAQASDPRVTGVGRVIRATRIDEIPQILNVFKGDMSFVGPRPERPFFVQELAAQIPFYNERHAVKPGITGWAQLNYPYGASVEDARMKLEYDLYYVKNYSVFLDLLIMLQTLRVVLWRDGVR